jgi:hypothetical protein
LHARIVARKESLNKEPTANRVSEESK